MLWRGAAVLCLSAWVTGCASSGPGTDANPVPANPDTTAAPVVHPRPPASAADNMAPNLLAWDAVFKEYRAKAGETNAPFTFSLKNVSAEPIVIYATQTTCDCTVAQLPANPWMVPVGGAGQIHAAVDLRGKTGAVTNYVIVFTSKGNRLLTVKATLPKLKTGSPAPPGK